ncbi:MAG TPA: hypothetical protein IAA04_07480 [Candidatus Lachnoclostridium pullistercoris]|uniref:Crp/Fnr family transcriptional regulator n=1 Tax=Candidatus Lachnoclostridium pullistercoris TaxID=2838632 RepID=A0A9D2T616_9FIRM|nr:hypothetical protein [Candidatus Lachnoclostridium pullistercoris]
MKQMMDIQEFAVEILGLKEKTAVEYLKEKGAMEPVKKRTKLFSEGVKPEYVILNVEGVFRGYFINEEDCEVTDCLVNTPGSSLMPGFDLDAPAPASVEALTAGCVFKLRLSDFKELVKGSPAVGELYRNEVQRAGQYHLDKSRVISGCTAKMKYQWFLKTHPGMENRIPDRHIAAFLRMSPVTLSQIKRKLREKNEQEK